MRAKITHDDGTVVEVEGTPDEVGEFCRRHVGRAERVFSPAWPPDIVTAPVTWPQSPTIHVPEMPDRVTITCSTDMRSESNARFIPTRKTSGEIRARLAVYPDTRTPDVSTQ